MWLPFICLTAGAVLAKILHPIADRLMQYSLFVLLWGLGARIGADEDLVAAIPLLGIKALILCVLASAASILLVMIWEKIFLKDTIRIQSNHENASQQVFTHEYRFIILVFLCMVFGIGMGYFFPIPEKILSGMILLTLIAIYVSVGVGLKDGLAGLGSNANILAYLAVPVLILLGSIGGGLVSAFIFDLDPFVAGGVGGSVGYYSLTAAMVTQKAGVEFGFIAFLTNFIREVLTFFLTPWLVRLSSLAPIALGGATTMDTTLAVMQRYLDDGHVIIAFLSGVILTLVVPFLLVFILSL